MNPRTPVFKELTDQRVQPVDASGGNVGGYDTEDEVWDRGVSRVPLGPWEPQRDVSDSASEGPLSWAWKTFTQEGGP